MSEHDDWFDIAEAVPESEEPPLCHCGKHYQGAECKTIIILAKRPRKPWEIYCPRCDFVFERTKVAIARAWAQEHNTKKHNGELEILDRTQPADPRSPVGNSW